MPDTYVYEDLLCFLKTGKLPEAAKTWGHQKRRNFLVRDSKKFEYRSKKMNTTSCDMAIFISIKLLDPKGNKEPVWREFPPPERRQEIIKEYHLLSGHSR